MTSTEPTRKPTAKEIAEAAEALAQEALTTSQQVLAEVRDLKEGAAPAMVVNGAPDPKINERLDKLDEDIDGLLANLNTLSQAVHAPVMGADGQPLDLSTVVVEMRKAFTEHAQKIDANNEAARKAIAEIRSILDSGAAGAAVGKLTQLGVEVAELKGWIQTFDEAGVGPASAEDVDSLHNRLSTVERYLSADGPVAAEHGTASPSNVPAGVPAIHRQVWRLMNRVTELGKDSQADKSMGGYKFRSIDSAMSAVGHALREIGLMFLPGEILDKRIERYTTQGHEWRNGTRYDKTLNWTHVWVTQRYYFVSLIDGSKSEPFEMDGEARDNGDKSTSKADSMRMKYALLQALCIPTEGLPESDGRDGTEGVDWGSAPPVGSGRGQAQEDPWADAPPTDDAQPQYQPGDEQRAQSGTPQQQPLADQKPVDNRADDEKAQAAVKALRDLNALAPDKRRDQFARIAKAVLDQRIGLMMVEGVTVNRHLAATNGTLGGS